VPFLFIGNSDIISLSISFVNYFFKEFFKTF
jgi:hypothetical protein